MEQRDNIKDFTYYVVTHRRSLIHEDTSRLALQFLALSNAFGGEAGELQNIVKKIIRHGVLVKDSGLHDKFVEEAGDALHYLFSLINIAGYSVEHIMRANIAKLDKRRDNEAKTGLHSASPTQ